MQEFVFSNRAHAGLITPIEVTYQDRIYPKALLTAISVDSATLVEKALVFTAGSFCNWNSGKATVRPGANYPGIFYRGPENANVERHHLHNWITGICELHHRTATYKNRCKFPVVISFQFHKPS